MKAIILAGGMGAAAIRALGKPEHVLYDLKYLLPASDSDLRLWLLNPKECPQQAGKSLRHCSRSSVVEFWRYASSA